MSRSKRVTWADLPDARRLLTPEFVSFFSALEIGFRPQIEAARAQRAASLRRAHAGEAPSGSPSSEGSATWQIPPLPPVLQEPGVEISGPAATTSMMINALNPGPDGRRAVGYLDDDEDSGGHSLADTLQAACNRVAALEGTLEFRDTARGREYRVAPGQLPFFMHRERGLHLDEPEMTLDGRPVAATVLGTALTLFHAGRAHAGRGDSIHFYLPKTESVAEAALYRDLFDAARARLPHLERAPIRAILLVESLPAAWQMEEMLFALGPYAAGLNAAR